MALRSSTMSMPFSDRSMEPRPEQYNLLRKLVIVLLLVVSSSLWLFILFREKRLAYSTFTQELTAGIVIAIVAGLGAQLILSKRDGLFRFVAAMAGDVAGIYILGFVSRGKYGISKFGWLPKAVDYDGLNLIGLGLIIILFMCLMFRRTRVIVIPEPVQVIPPESEPEVYSPVQVEPSIVTTTNAERPRISWTRFFAPGSISPPRTNGRRNGGMIQPAKVAPAMPKRRKRNKKARVQLALVEEHRCPYCFDTVTRKDPRGVKECPVCHTLHHKDCWDVTGSCQVPHLNN